MAKKLEKSLGRDCEDRLKKGLRRDIRKDWGIAEHETETRDW